MITIKYAKSSSNMAEYFIKVNTVHAWLSDNIGPPGHGWHIHMGSFVIIEDEFAEQATAFKLLYGI